MAEALGCNDEILYVHCLKSFLTGWVNTLTFVRYGCFGTMQTGNGILLARALVDKRWDDAMFFTAIIVWYYAGLFVYRGLDLALSYRDRHDASMSPYVAPLYFVLLCATDACVWQFGAGTHGRYELCFVALAFGGMNSLAVQISPVVTHAITGNLNRVANALFDALFEEAGLREKQRREAWLSLWVSITFLMGVAACAQFVHSCPQLSHSGFVPVAVVQCLWLWNHDRVFAREKQALALSRKEARDAARYAASIAAAAEEAARRKQSYGAALRTSSLPQDLSEAMLRPLDGLALRHE